MYKIGKEILNMKQLEERYGEQMAKTASKYEGQNDFVLLLPIKDCFYSTNSYYKMTRKNFKNLVNNAKSELSDLIKSVNKNKEYNDSLKAYFQEQFKRLMIIFNGFVYIDVD